MHSALLAAIMVLRQIAVVHCRRWQSTLELISWGGGWIVGRAREELGIWGTEKSTYYYALLAIKSNENE